MYQLILTIFLLVANPQPTKSSDVSIVANDTVSDVKLSRLELIRIFTKNQKFWSDGHKITVFTKPISTLEHKMFVVTVLNLTLFKYKTLLESAVYSGQNTNIIEVDSDEEMLIRLSNTPYSIGYINYTIVANKNKQDLINIQVD